jgi:hypothetical protein
MPKRVAAMALRCPRCKVGHLLFPRSCSHQAFAMVCVYSDPIEGTPVFARASLTRRIELRVRSCDVFAPYFLSFLKLGVCCDDELALAVLLLAATPDSCNDTDSKAAAREVANRRVDASLAAKTCSSNHRFE